MEIASKMMQNMLLYYYLCVILTVLVNIFKRYTKYDIKHKIHYLQNYHKYTFSQFMFVSIIKNKNINYYFVVIWRCWFSFPLLHTTQRTVPVQAGGHHRMKPTEPHHLRKAEMKLWNYPSESLPPLGYA